MQNPESYQPKNPIRIVTAASLFDGHDAAINIMRRILQSSGAEVIHLGHNRSVREVVDCAIQEDAQAVCNRLLSLSKADECTFNLNGSRTGNSSSLPAGSGATCWPSTTSGLAKRSKMPSATIWA